MKRISLIPDQVYSTTSVIQVTNVVKIELQHLDGTLSEAKLTFPSFTNWSEPAELANIYLSELVNYWSKYWLKIKSYQVSIGSIDSTGTEHYTMFYEPFEIPINKIFVPTNRISGTWQTPAVIQKREKATQLKTMKKNMESGKHAVNGSPLSPSIKSGFCYLN